MTRSNATSLRAVVVALALAASAAVHAADGRYIVVLESSAQRSATAPDQAQAGIDALLANVSAAIGRSPAAGHRYRHALHGSVLALTAQEARTVAALPGVRAVIPDAMLPVEAIGPAGARLPATAPNRADPLPDPVAAQLGAPGVWDGSATGLPPNLGEGTIIGVVGTGVNGDHPAFAEVGGDGYQHVNPLGSGVFLGECATRPEIHCNDKLIGRWAFLPDSDLTSEDDYGAGTLALAQAAGNRLFDVALPDADGNPTGIVLDELSGVAPHANVIAYRVCTDLCFLSDAIRALDQAQADGVDVLIYTVGNQSGSPWEYFLSVVFQSLHAQGMTVAVNVGRYGPDYGTVSRAAVAPWTVSFTAASHARDYSGKELREFQGGVDMPTAAIEGRGRSGAVTAPVVDAAGFANPNDPLGDPAQCAQPFPAGTFNGEIVLCDRGGIPRFMKSIHVADGGAGGIVLANTPDGASNLASDFFAVPGIHVDAAAGQSLRQWLAAGDGHIATITASVPVDDPALADRLSAFGSRGPHTGLDFLAPSLTAPARDVYGAWAGEQNYQFFGEGFGSYPGAGAIALVAAAHPDWTVAEVQSALMTTAFDGVVLEPDVEVSDPLTFGAGRIDVAKAVRAALVLNAKTDSMIAADPALGGEPGDINLAGLVETACERRCTWTRIVRATRDGHWQALGEARDDDAVIAVSPAEFSLQAGETQALTIGFDGSAAAAGGYRFGRVVLALEGADAPDSVLQLAVDLFADVDNDGVANRFDNCTLLANAAQRDSDGDGFGNRCDGDLDNSGMVNSIDLGIMRQSFADQSPHADLDGDGVVNANDVDILRELFHAPPGPGGEPAAR